MPIRIELFAKDIKSATEVVEYALSMDCALVSYASVVDTRKPLPARKESYNPKAERSGPVKSFKISCGSSNPFTEGSMRYKMWKAAKLRWPTGYIGVSRQAFNQFLRDNKIKAADAASIYRGFQDKGVLTPQ